MSCSFEQDLTAYLDQELPAMEAARVAAHLPGCPDCRATEALLRQSLEALAALPAFEPSLALRRSLLSRVDALPPSLGTRLRALLRPWVLLPTGGLVAAGLVVTVLLLRQPRPPELSPPAQLELAMNFDVVDNYEVLGIDSPEDLAVVEHLQELEKTP
jgi:anti-sigma factor RsiW